jgi:hypothetical protein
MRRRFRPTRSAPFCNINNSRIDFKGMLHSQNVRLASFQMKRRPILHRGHATLLFNISSCQTKNTNIEYIILHSGLYE